MASIPWSSRPPLDGNGRVGSEQRRRTGDAAEGTRHDTAGYVLTVIGAFLGAAGGAGTGILIALASLDDVAGRAVEESGVVEGLVETFAVGVLLWLAIPVLGMLGCGLGCYVALRAGKQRAAFRTAALTVVLLLVAFLFSDVLPGDSLALVVVWLGAAAVLARRIAAGSASVAPRELEGRAEP